MTKLDELENCIKNGSQIILGPNSSSRVRFIHEMANCMFILLITIYQLLIYLDYNISMVSGSSTSLSITRSKFPYFYRTCPDDRYQSYVIVETLNAFNWKQAILLIRKEEYSLALSQRLIEDSLNYNINYTKYFVEREVSATLCRLITESNIKIIIAIAPVLVFDPCFEKFTHSNGYVWVLSEGYGAHVYAAEELYWLRRNSIVARPPTQPYFQNELNEYLDMIRNFHENCTNLKNIAFYDTYIINSVVAVFETYKKCIAEDIEDCNSGVFGSLLNSLEMENLGTYYNFSAENVIPSYDIHRLDNESTSIVSTFLSKGCDKAKFCNDNSLDSITCENYVKIYESNHTVGCTIVNYAAWPGKDIEIPGDGSKDPYFINLDHYISILAFVLTFILLSILTLTISLVLKYGNTLIIQNTGKPFLILVFVGLMLVSISSLFYIGLPNELMCNLRFWTFYLGFTIVIIPLILKALTLNIGKSNYMITKRRSMMLIIFVIIPVLLLCILYSSLVRPYRMVIGDFGTEIITCSSDNKLASTMVLYITFAFFSCLSIVYFIFAMNTVEADESDYLKIISYLILINFWIGGGLTTIINNLNGVALSYILMTFISVILIWGVLFIPKVLIYIAPKDN